jgi:hypothetical protein
MFAAVIGKGLPNEEKVLVESRTGANLTIHQRGYDDTVPANHSATEPVEHCHTATDDDEANAHSSGTDGHGVPVSDHIVGEKKAATLENKTIDGTKNTFQNIPSTATPETAGRLDDLEDADDDFADALAAETTARANADAAEATARTNADNARYTKAEADAAFLDQTEADARYAKPFVDSGWQTATTGFAPATNWTLSSVRWRTVTQTTSDGTITFIDVSIVMQRNATALSVGTKGDVPNTAMCTLPAALRPTALLNLLGPSSGAGRMCAAQLDVTGILSITAAGGTAAIASEQISVRGFYIK